MEGIKINVLITKMIGTQPILVHFENQNARRTPYQEPIPLGGNPPLRMSSLPRSQASLSDPSHKDRNETNGESSPVSLCSSSFGDVPIGWFLRDSFGEAERNKYKLGNDFRVISLHNAALRLDGLQDFVQRCESHEMETIWQK
jgi:hypothetical protein